MKTGIRTLASKNPTVLLGQHVFAWKVITKIVILRSFMWAALCRTPTDAAHVVHISVLPELTEQIVSSLFLQKIKQQESLWLAEKNIREESIYLPSCLWDLFIICVRESLVSCTSRCWNKHERMERMGESCKVHTQNQVFQSHPISWSRKNTCLVNSIYISIILSNEAIV